MNASHPAIADLIPQSGAMVLLDDVVRYDERTIACRATSHRRADHPLAWQATVPAWAGIEYASQAMAAHFALLQRASGRETIGLLGGLRDVACMVARLDDIPQPLLVEAERLARDAAGSIYAFRIAVEDEGRVLVTGRATVVQQARAPSP